MLAFLCALPILAAQAEQPVSDQSTPEGSVIEVGQEVVGEVEAGWVVEYFLHAKAGDYVMGVVICQGKKILVEAQDPTLGDSPLFGANTYQDVVPFGFYAPIKVHSESTKPSPFRLFVGFQEPLGKTAFNRAKKFFSLQPPSLPGSSMAIVQEGKIQMLETRGTIGEGSADSLTLQIPFDCPDLLVPFLESAFLRLEMEGRFDSTSEVHEHLQWFPDYAPPVTVKQVIRAMSGLPGLQPLHELKQWNPQAAQVSPQEARNLLSKNHLRTTQWGHLPYGNSSDTLLLLELLQAFTNLDSVAALEQALFQPFGMEHTRLIEGDRALPSIQTTPEDFARWMAALQSMQVEKTNGMMYLHRINAIPKNYWGDNWSLIVKPDESWVVMQMNAEGSILKKFSFLSLHTVLDEPWPWITPGFDVGLGGGYGDGPIPYKVGADSPRLGRFRSEALDLEIEIQSKDGRFLLVGPDGKGMPVERTRNGGWNIPGDLYLSLIFNRVSEGTGGSSHRDLPHCLVRQAVR